MKISFLKRTIGILLLLMLSSNEVRSQEVIDSICAIIDNEIILESEVGYGISSLLLEQGIRRPTPAQFAEARSRVLQAFVIQKIMLSKAEEDTLQIKDRLVDKELTRKIEQLTNQAGGEANLVEYFGRPLRQIKREMRKGVREGLLIEMVKRKYLSNAQIRRQDVYKFYEENREQLPVIPDQVELSHILLEVKPSEDARSRAMSKIETALSRLKAGEKFEDVARDLSDDPSKDTGGALGFTNRGDLVPEYEVAAYELEPGTISGIVETGFGFHIIKLIERQGERISTSHILAKLDPTDSDRESTITFANQLLDSIRVGVSFDSLALRHSSDEKSRENGGKLNLLTAEELPSEFKLAILNKASGDYTEPFETAFGVHIVRIDRSIPSHALTPETDWETLELYATNSRRERQFQEWVGKLRTNHYIWPDRIAE